MDGLALSRSCKGFDATIEVVIIQVIPWSSTAVRALRFESADGFNVA